MSSLENINSCNNEEEEDPFDGNAPPLPEILDHILPRLQRNDQSVASLHAYWRENAFVNNVDWETNSIYLAQSTHLKTLQIELLDTSYRPGGYWMGGPTKSNFEAFCNGLAQNRSIERLCIRNCPCMDSLIEIISPFIEHNSNLRHLALEGSGLDSATARRLTEVLSSRGKSSSSSSLTRLELVATLIGGEESRELISVLDEHYSRHLVRLCMGGNHIGLRACVELGKLLQNPHCQLQDLRLECNDLDDACLDVLTSALAKNKTLKKISLCQNTEITARGWQTFASVLRTSVGCPLEALHISETSLDDGGAASISQELATNTKLKVLDLYYSEFISFGGWEAFFNRLQNNTSSALEEVNLSENNIDDEVAVAFANAFSNVGSTLKSLRLDDNRSIQSTGWQAISSLLQIHKNSLVDIDLSMNDIEDPPAVSLAFALKNSPSLKVLNLSCTRSIGTAGWTAFAECFQNSRIESLDVSMNGGIRDEEGVILANAFISMPTLKKLKFYGLDHITCAGWRTVLAILGSTNNVMSLEELKLSINGIDDRGAVMFANSLANNTTLNALDLDSNRLITEVGWRAFSNVVCNTSSIPNIVTSNHTLYQICDNQYRRLPPDIVYALRLNRNSDKREVIRRKILWSHFRDDDMDIREFLSMELNILPHVLAWGGRDYMGHTLLYNLVRSMPLLGEHVDKKPRADNSKATPWFCGKRKLDSLS